MKASSVFVAAPGLVAAGAGGTQPRVGRQRISGLSKPPGRGAEIILDVS